MATTTLDTIRGSVARANERFEAAFNAGDPSGAARAIYTRDATVLPPGAPMIQGRDAIAGFWEAAARQMQIGRCHLATLELVPLGDGAYEIGRATLTLVNGQEVVVKYVVVWKEEEGDWKWHVDIWNPNE